MNEKELAGRAAVNCARRYVDKMGGITLSGNTLGEMYFNENANSQGVEKATKVYSALRHWCVCAGYNNADEFKIVLSSYILNC